MSMLEGKVPIDPDNPELTRGIAGLLRAFMLEKQQCRGAGFFAAPARRDGRFEWFAESVACATVATSCNHGCVAIDAGRLQTSLVLIPKLGLLGTQLVEIVP
jgi:hypothetical protein